jgi:hypothetical protein
MDVSSSSTLARGRGRASRHVAPQRSDEPGNLAGFRHAADVPLREDGAAIDRDRQLAQATPADLRRHIEGCAQLVAKAHGLAPQIQSERATLDLDVHRPR